MTNTKCPVETRDDCPCGQARPGRPSAMRQIIGCCPVGGANKTWQGWTATRPCCLLEQESGPGSRVSSEHTVQARVTSEHTVQARPQLSCEMLPAQFTPRRRRRSERSKHGWRRRLLLVPFAALDPANGAAFGYPKAQPSDILLRLRI
jgi:hypothetical protein